MNGRAIYSRHFDSNKELFEAWVIAQYDTTITSQRLSDVLDDALQHGTIDSSNPNIQEARAASFEAVIREHMLRKSIHVRNYLHAYVDT